MERKTYCLRYGIDEELYTYGDNDRNIFKDIKAIGGKLKLVNTYSRRVAADTVDKICQLEDLETKKRLATLAMLIDYKLPVEVWIAGHLVAETMDEFIDILQEIEIITEDDDGFIEVECDLGYFKKQIKEALDADNDELLNKCLKNYEKAKLIAIIIKREYRYMI